MLPGRPKPRPPRLEEVDGEDVQRGHRVQKVHDEEEVHLAENACEQADRPVKTRLERRPCLRSSLREKMVVFSFAADC